jgi:hypothetical protein
MRIFKLVLAIFFVAGVAIAVTYGVAYLILTNKDGWRNAGGVVLLLIVIALFSYAITYIEDYFKKH